MTNRSTMPNRPWLVGAQHDKYNVPNMVHHDLYAFRDVFGIMYFEILTTEHGKKPYAWAMFRSVPSVGMWDSLDYSNRPDDLRPVRWTRETHADFRHAHGRLLALCGVPPGFNTRSVLCHYVKPYDADPWPRGTLNTWRMPQYGEGKRPGRPRKILVDMPDII